MKEKPKIPHTNARAETVDKLPLFRECQEAGANPATGFFEWQKRAPYRFIRADMAPFAFGRIPR